MRWMVHHTAPYRSREGKILQVASLADVCSLWIHINSRLEKYDSNFYKNILFTVYLFSCSYVFLLCGPYVLSKWDFPPFQNGFWL